MSTSALILMLTYCGLVTAVAAYFFIRVIQTPTKQHSEKGLPESEQNK